MFFITRWYLHCWLTICFFVVFIYLFLIVQVSNPKKNSYIYSGKLDGVYRALQFHFHWNTGSQISGSEHQINGHTFPLEVIPENRFHFGDFFFIFTFYHLHEIKAVFLLHFWGRLKNIWRINKIFFFNLHLLISYPWNRIY